jgi:hypothetical protein
MAEQSPGSLSRVRLGRLEKAILEALERGGGFLQREDAVEYAFPRLRSRAPGTQSRSVARQHQRERARAEAAISRAIVSLERKELLVREHNPRTGRTLLRAPDQPRLPDWEEIARAEEDLAAFCLRMAKEWTSLARRSQRRAAAVRDERSVEETERERQADLAEIDRMQGEEREQG